jgi:hypothetical protein
MILYLSKGEIFFVNVFDTMPGRKWENFSIRRIAKGGSPLREIP